MKTIKSISIILAFMFAISSFTLSAQQGASKQQVFKLDIVPNTNLRQLKVSVKGKTLKIAANIVGERDVVLFRIENSTEEESIEVQSARSLYLGTATYNIDFNAGELELQKKPSGFGIGVNSNTNTRKYKIYHPQLADEEQNVVNDFAIILRTGRNGKSNVYIAYTGQQNGKQAIGSAQLIPQVLNNSRRRK